MNFVLKRLSKKKEKVHSFTYYIPAPPLRKSGYREKEFDRIFNLLTQRGFEVIDIKTQSHQSKENSGMWVILLLRGDYSNHDELMNSLDNQFKDNDKAPVNNRIEGLYYDDN